MDLKQTSSSSVTSSAVKDFLTKAQSSHMIPHFTKEEKKVSISLWLNFILF